MGFWTDPEDDITGPAALAVFALHGLPVAPEPITLTLTPEQAKHVASAISIRLSRLGSPQKGYFSQERYDELWAEINALQYAYDRLV